MITGARSLKCGFVRVQRLDQGSRGRRPSDSIGPVPASSGSRPQAAQDAEKTRRPRSGRATTATGTGHPQDRPERPQKARISRTSRRTVTDTRIKKARPIRGGPPSNIRIRCRRGSGLTIMALYPTRSAGRDHPAPLRRPAGSATSPNPGSRDHRFLAHSAGCRTQPHTGTYRGERESETPARARPRTRTSEPHKSANNSNVTASTR